MPRHLDRWALVGGPLARTGLAVFVGYLAAVTGAAAWRLKRSDV